MEDKIQQHITGMADACMAAEVFASKSAEEKNTLYIKLEDHFYQVMFDTLLDQLDDIQLADLESVADSEEKTSETLIRLAAEVPDFLSLVEHAIAKEAETIKKTGEIPVNDNTTS